MSQWDDSSLSRRRALGLASALAVSQASAQPRTAPGNDSSQGARVYNVRDFGSKGDGATLDTAAVQTAIDPCHRDQGGTVLVPAGVFVIGTTELKTNVTLHLAAGALLLGSADG